MAAFPDLAPLVCRKVFAVIEFGMAAATAGGKEHVVSFEPCPLAVIAPVGVTRFGRSAIARAINPQRARQLIRQIQQRAVAVVHATVGTRSHIRSIASGVSSGQ